MENMKPPNYYGVPYPNNMDNNMKPPYGGMGPNNPQNYVDPNINVPHPQAMMNRDDNSSQDNQTYFTKVLSEHRGQKVSVYCSFTDAADWHDRVFEGYLVDSGDDYVVLDEKKINKHILILSVYIHFIEFEDETKK